MSCLQVLAGDDGPIDLSHLTQLTSLELIYAGGHGRPRNVEDVALQLPPSLVHLRLMLQDYYHPIESSAREQPFSVAGNASIALPHLESFSGHVCALGNTMPASLIALRVFMTCKSTTESNMVHHNALLRRILPRLQGLRHLQLTWDRNERTDRVTPDVRPLLAVLPPSLTVLRLYNKVCSRNSLSVTVCPQTAL